MGVIYSWNDIACNDGADSCESKVGAERKVHFFALEPVGSDGRLGDAHALASESEDEAPGQHYGEAFIVAAEHENSLPKGNEDREGDKAGPDTNLIEQDTADERQHEVWRRVQRHKQAILRGINIQGFFESTLQRRRIVGAEVITHEEETAEHQHDPAQSSLLHELLLGFFRITVAIDVCVVRLLQVHLTVFRL